MCRALPADRSSGLALLRSKVICIALTHCKKKVGQRTGAYFSNFVYNSVPFFHFDFYLSSPFLHLLSGSGRAQGVGPSSRASDKLLSAGERD